MYSLTKGYRRANLWLDQVPPADFAASSLVKRVMTPKRVVTASHRIAAIELSGPPGPSSYALLGGELVESDVCGLEVVISVNPEGARFKSSLVAIGDDVLVGLDDEYVLGVMAGIERVNQLSGLPSGASLRFRWAAHGSVGSSNMIFTKASSLVVQLLTLRKDAPEKKMTEIVFG